MPLPICPAPTTPIFSIFIAALPISRFAPGAFCASAKDLTASLGATLTLQCTLEFGQRLKQVRDQSIVGDAEDRCPFILVDGDDDLGILHSGEMLDRARDPDRDVEFRRYDFARLSDLM